jgi:hypothetical protein
MPERAEKTIHPDAHMHGFDLTSVEGDGFFSYPTGLEVHGLEGIRSQKEKGLFQSLSTGDIAQ